MTVEFGFNLPQGAAPQELLAFARRAEKLGIDHVWSNDHLVALPDAEKPQHEAWTVLSFIAGATSRIRMGHQVLCQGWRNPALLAKAAATLDYLSGGRLEFGIGAGWYSQEYETYGFPFPSTGARLQQLREAIEICKRLWTEDTVTYEGTHYAVQDAVCVPKPAQQPHPRIVVAGVGERVMLRIVAEHADIWNTYQAGSRVRRERYETLLRHCDAVGRDPAEIKTAQQIVLTVTETEAEADRLLAQQRTAGGFHDPDLGITGHPPRVIERVHELIAEGVQIINFTNTGGGGHTLAQLDLFAAAVLPHVS